MSENKIRIFNEYIRISRDELINKYKNDSNLDKILSLFDRIKEEDDGLWANRPSVDITKYRIDENGDREISDDEIKLFLQQNYHAKELNTDFVTLKKFLKAISDKESEEIEQLSKENDLPVDLVRTLSRADISPNEVQKVQGENGETLYKVSYGGIVNRLLNAKGKLVEETEINNGYHMDKESKDSWNMKRYKKTDEGWTEEFINSDTGLKTKMFIDKEGNETKRITQTKDMLMEQSFENGKPQLDTMKLCDEFGGLIDMELSYDENGVVNGININTTPGKVKSNPIDNTVFEYETEPPKVSDELISKLIETINNGGNIRGDFDMRIENGALRLVPRVTKVVYDEDTGDIYYEDIKLPSKLEDKMMDLIQQGYKVGTDFEITEQEDGEFTINYASGDVLDYECNNKIEFYNENGEFLEEVRNVGYSESFLCQNIEELPNQNLISEINRTVIDANSFNEVINGVNYEVNLENNELKIKRGGEKELTINVSGLKKNFVQKVLMQVNAMTLYHLAKKKTIIQYSKLPEDVNGEYEPKTNTLHLNKRISNIDEFKRVIVHESGHMFDTKDDKNYAIEVIKDMIKINPSINSSGKSIDKMLEERGTRQLSSRLNNELINTINMEMQKAFNINISIPKSDDSPFIAMGIKNHIMDNYMQTDVNKFYALESVEEFFAEAYSLIVSGNCKSAELLLTYFPESLELVKKIIEKEETFR